MGEKMTLEAVRYELRQIEKFAGSVSAAAWTDAFPPRVLAKRFAQWADALDARLAQPAQAVDVGAIMEVAYAIRHHRGDKAFYSALADKLTAALPNANGKEGVDSMLLDWLEDQAIRSPTGISLDYCRYVEDGLVLEQGYRFMRRHFLGDRKATLREAIKSAMAVAR